jgi:rod shape determining protein RodA
MFDRRFVQYFDWGLLGLALALGAVGIMTLYSAVTAGTEAPVRILYMKQMLWLGIGLSVMMGSLFINYRNLERWAPVLYAGCVVLLVAVLVGGKYVSGSRRWLVLGPLSIQPSELAKLAVILILARYYARHASTAGLNLRRLAKPLLLVALPFALIVNQPDLGTAALLVLIAASMTLFVKIDRRSLLYIGASSIVTGPLVWFFLKDYQKQRILTFLNPERDPLGAGYHIIQSKIAIGSGMLTGKGYLEGTQNALSFLPEQHTDFIFSVLAEEWGFVGGATLIVIFLLLIIWALTVAYGCREPFGTILAVGITAMLFWQVAINIGMVMGLMPVVGVPLPLVSYGGSSVLSILLGIGFLMNISMRRFMLE